MGRGIARMESRAANGIQPAGSRPVKMPAYLKNARKARFVTTEPTSQCFAAVLLSLS